MDWIMLLLMKLLWVLPAGNALSSHNSKLRREVWELKQTVQEFSKEREKHKEYEKLPIYCLSRALPGLVDQVDKC